ncbi:MAG: aspartate aminotransferase [Flavobacteriaceae bacterium]|nr:aspartate aminotransferase [Flavobacteriaceae bacterium]|tara:strand:- start:46 stop:1230 length:1185 start_codon:yes stop_codon:yes gene_type:complete
MNKFLTDKVNNLSASATLAMAAKARELRSKGVDVIGLSLGEPDFNIPEFIKEAAVKAINDNYNSYTPVDGYVDLKKAISRKFSRDNNLNYSAGQIVVSTGAKQSIANVIEAMINPGDEVILLAPFWVSYSAMIEICGGIPVIVKSDITSNFKVTASKIKDNITSKTKMIIVNSPNNPSGSVYNENELRQIGKMLMDYPKIFVLSDEIYEHINYGVKHFSFASIPEMYDRTITVNGVAKAFAMTGWRIGYLGAPEWLAKACTKLQGQSTSGANCIAQKATIAALDANVNQIKYMIDEFSERRELIIDLLSEIEGFKLNNPDGAFYIFPDISYFFGKTINGFEIKNSTDFSLFILEKAHVATVTGEAFGSPNNIRISYAASRENIKKAVDRIKSIF